MPRTVRRSLWTSLLTPLVVLVALTTVGAAARAEALFDPKTTWAVVAGVLEWKDPGLNPFPKELRKDKELFETLGKLGVPATQRALLLDERATAPAIEKAVREMVGKAPAGATLIVYYAGHGVKDQEGHVIFASADIALDKLDATGLHVDAIPSWMKGFKGRRVLLLADCCYSGGLIGPAGVLGKAGLQVLSLTSAEASNISTSNWTFTETVLEALAGRTLFDRDEDGGVELGELHAEVKDGMRNREGQRSGWLAVGLGDDLVVAPSKLPDDKPTDRGTGDPDPRGSPGRAAGGNAEGVGGGFEIGDWVRAPHNDKMAPARILGVRGSGGKRGLPKELYVEFFDYATVSAAWVDRTATNALDFTTYPVGTALRVTWGNKVYDAKVTAVEDGFMRITYPGYEAKWDEWITTRRVVGLAGQPDKRKALQVKWKGNWYPAHLNEKRDGKWCISYDGFGSDWDECVDKDRVRE